jgi:hypothetical protein
MYPPSHPASKACPAPASRRQSPREWGRGKEPSLTAELSGAWQGTELSVLNSQWCTTKQQRLRAEAGWQANLLKGTLAPRRDQEIHKGRRWIPKPISGTKGSTQNWIVQPCWGKSWRTSQLKKKSYDHLTTPTNLVDIASHLVRSHQSFRLNTRIGHLRNNWTSSWT